MTIIKHGVNPQTNTCGRCGCIFSYNNADVKNFYDNDYADARLAVMCPECNNQTPAMRIITLRPSHDADFDY